MPLEKVLWICSAVVAKSKPDADAISPVIFSNVFNSSAFLETSARFAEPLWISCNENGT